MFSFCDLHIIHKKYLIILLRIYIVKKLTFLCEHSMIKTKGVISVLAERTA